MNFSTLQRQLVREFRASPAKATALVLLFFVGVYFWAPIVIGRLTKKPSASQPAPGVVAAQPATGLDVVSPAPNAAAKGDPGLPDWHDVADWIKQDARMSATAWTEGGRDPFSVVKKTKPAVPAKPEAKKTAPAKPKEIDPDSLGLAVSSIALGPGGRTALINGETYREGHTIEMEDGLRVTLKRVLPKRVQFECQGQSFELAVAGGGASAIKLRKP